MKITDLLKKNGIALNPKVDSKEEAINKLVDLMDATGRLRDKEAYKKARDAEYEAKRAGTPKRKEHKRQQYLRHREDKLAYSKKYYEEHKEEIKAKYRANKEKNVEYSRKYYAEHKEEICAKQRLKYKKRKDKGQCI